MPFDLETWKAKLSERLQNWRPQMNQMGAKSIYAFLSAATLWPVVEAARGGEWAALAALGGVSAGVGGNLLANRIQSWRDEAEAVQQIATDVAADPSLQMELNAVLEKLDALAQAQQALPEVDRKWFVETLRAELAHQGNLARFEAQLTGHGAIVQAPHAQNVVAQGTLIGGDVRGDYLGPGATKIINAPLEPSRDNHVEARRRYLLRLRRFCQVLPLAALGREEGADADLTLDQIYIELDTTTRVSVSDSERQQYRLLSPPPPLHDEGRLLTALEAATLTSRVALLGDPGSGKSTFVHKLVGWLAAALLGEADPPPNLSHDLLPILITLRDLVPRLASLELSILSHDDRRMALATAVSKQVLSDLNPWEASDFAQELREALTVGRCLLVLDGLDEVPQELRTLVRSATAAVIQECAVQHVIVTCRMRSYVGEAILPDFQAHTLAPFDGSKIGAFASAWYNAQRELGRVDAQQAWYKAVDLFRAALTDELHEMAANPMLLTTMAIIHQRDIGLPKERVRLYNLAAEVLLRRWQRSKVGETGLAQEPGLVAFLNDELRLRGAMEALAYEAHRAGQGGQALGELTRGNALTLLEKAEYLGNVGTASGFLDYVDQRAGLLLGRGGESDKPTSYGFPHKTFEEYLAGCHLIGQRDAARRVLAHAAQGDYWTLAVQLGAEELLYNRRSRNTLLDLAYDLCRWNDPRNAAEQRLLLWSGIMAALAGREPIEHDSSPKGGPAYLERLIPRLLGLLRSDLTPPERVDAGNVLARLGDPRFRPDAWFLPGEGLLGFVEISAGPFLMGNNEEGSSPLVDNERPLHEVTPPRYYIARYPTTVEQFRVFMRESGYRPLQNEWLRGLSNHPVVQVTWYDAIEYCKWLTERPRDWEGTPEPLATLLCQEGWVVTLPSEAEWEKAARGADGRKYPWGDDLAPHWADFLPVDASRTRAVGCFPRGASPYGVEEVNQTVSEWTRSLWGMPGPEPAFRYPYNPSDGREDLQAPDQVLRVLRGAGLWYCASRGALLPTNAWGNAGFRVVLRPPL